MADMEGSATGGTKRKHKDNAFTAKAETGTLKVKILRRDQKSGGLDLPASTAATTNTRSRRAARQPPPPPDSPPKPRPNRKHVPIFYDTQFRQPIKRGGSHSYSSSTDESASQSSTGVPGIHSTSSADASGSTSASTSSTSSRFVSQLSDVRLQSASSSGGDVGPPPRANPLFARNDSDGTLGDLLRSYFPSPSRGLQTNFRLGDSQSTGTTSSAGLLMDQTGLSSALHQLASSSASYRSALDALSTADHVSGTSSSVDVSTASSMATASAAAQSTSSSTLNTTHNDTSGGLEHYRFDPFTALQTAIAHAQRASSTNGSTDGSANQHNDRHREIGSRDSEARFFRLEPSGLSEATHSKNASAGSLGPPPELPPVFTLQNSLVGGGINGLTLPRHPIEANGIYKAERSSSSDGSNGKDAAGMPGLPHETSHSFLMQNSLVGGGISILDLPMSNPSLDRLSSLTSLDRLSSLTSLVSQGNETVKGESSSLTSPPKAHLSLERLVSMTSVTSEDGEATKSSNHNASHAAAEPGSADGAENNGAVDLGPPPSGPPAFTVGNSLMGGGIELQPPAANVNTHNFDWKLHRSGSTANGGDVHASPPKSGVSHGLRARLERTLASSKKGMDKS